MSIDTSDASKVLGAYSIAMFMIVGSMVIRFDRVELQHVITAENQGGFAVREHLTQEQIDAINLRLDHATPGTWGSGKVPGTIVAAVADKAVEESGVPRKLSTGTEGW